MTVRYVTGNATRPEPFNGLRVICHVCNDRGAWGAGFVMAISRRWKGPEQAYRGTRGLVLGDVQFSMVEPDIKVANMIAQDGFPTIENRVVLDYGALETCLLSIAECFAGRAVSLHMPRIGCGIAGGEWSKVEPIIARCASALPVTVYDLPNGQKWKA